jgi:hypothetical protein
MPGPRNWKAVWAGGPLPAPFTPFWPPLPSRVWSNKAGKSLPACASQRKEALAELEKGKEEWTIIVHILAHAPKNLPHFSEFVRLFSEALASGEISDLSSFLARANAELAAILGGENDGSRNR